MKAKKHSVKNAFDYYLKEIKISPSTKQNFGYTRDKVEKAGLLSTQLAELTPAMVLQFINSLTSLGETTKFLTYVQFKTVLNRYVRDHALPIVLRLERLLRAPKPRQTVEGEEEYLTLSEVKELLAIDLKDKPEVEKARDLFCLMAFTGMAIADLALFTPALISKDGRWLTYYRKKSGGKCEIPVLPLTHDLIDKYQWPHKIPNRTLQWQCKNFITPLVGKKVTPHAARHTFGCVFLEFGFSLESCSRMMGHQSIKITERIYAKVTRAKIEREMFEIPNGIRELMKS